MQTYVQEGEEAIIVVQDLGEINNRETERWEVEQALKQMKSGKPPCLDECQIEILRKMGKWQYGELVSGIGKCLLWSQ